jgi:hypothetical protein
MSFANNTSHMLFIVIPIAWLTVVTLFVAVCRSAARGDGRRAPSESDGTTVNTSIDGLVLWEDPAEVALRDMRPRKPHRLLAGHGLTHHGAR